MYPFLGNLEVATKLYIIIKIQFSDKKIKPEHQGLSLSMHCDNKDLSQFANE